MEFGKIDFDYSFFWLIWFFFWYLLIASQIIIKGKAPDMASDRQNLQDAFLNQVRKTKIPVTVFLINGVKLQGAITWFDNFCILLRRDGQSQLVYKHAVSTIMPTQSISLYDGEEEGWEQSKKT